MDNIFESLRDISASDIAIRMAIPLQRKGSRLWARCPFHGGGAEHTPSLVFDASGRFYCFACHAAGDAVDFYAMLKQVSLTNAAHSVAEIFSRSVCKQPYIPPPTPPKKILQDTLTVWFSREWSNACDSKHFANDIIDAVQLCADYVIQQSGMETRKAYSACYDNLDFCTALKSLAAAESRLEQLSCVDTRGLLGMMLEEQNV